MRKHILPINVIAILAVVALLCVVSGGCGGSSSRVVQDNTGYPSASVNCPETIFDLSDLSLLLTMDIDDNGMPDFLDFEGVPQFHVSNSASAPSGEIFDLESLLKAAEKNVPVPSMIWLNKLRMPGEDANVFSVNLEAGKEYTFEFSRNLTESLGSVLPNIRVYDPENSKLPAVEAKEMDYEVAAYPPEHPSILCYTIKATVSGTYIVEVANGEPTTNEDYDDSETDSVLFIYEEFRNEDDEIGYYTNFKFQDSDGNRTESIGISELIHLRQLFLNINPTYFDEVYGWNLPDDPSGKGNTNGSFAMRYDEGEYARFMYELQAILGFHIIEDEEEDESGESEDSSDDAPYELDPIILSPTYIGKEIIIASPAAEGSVAASELDDQPSKIDPQIDGIPYDAQYEIGKGFLATSNFKFITPTGGTEVDISGAYEEAKEAYLKLPASRQLPIQTDSYAQFVSTSMQAESLLKCTNNLSLSTAAVGVSLGSGTTNNLKFGLNATNLVIHYEEVENGYRRLKDKQIEAAWEDAGLWEFIDNMTSGDNFAAEFRNELGDYYVAGYQYGACYDAYISIMTETREETREVEKKLSASLNLDDVTASADLSSKLRETLNQYGATFNVRIVTNGMGNSVPTEVPLGEGVASNDVKALDKVGESLMEFLGKVRSSTNRSAYSPIRVRLTRWRKNLKMASKMKKMGDKTGLIPITVGHRKTIAGFNSRMKELMGYHNIVGDNPDVPSSAKSDIEQIYKEIVENVTAGGEDFYKDKNAVTSNLERIKAISPKFKALSDRYVFYRMLVRAQEAEKKIYDYLKTEADKLGEGNNYEFVKQMPFGHASYGGSSGFDKFAYSTYVTDDINAGGAELHKQYYRLNYETAERREWHSNHKEGEEDYLPSAGAATLTATTNDGSEAVFCQVRVESTSKNKETDRKRELVRGAPAVGTSVVGFEFLSGRGDNVNWNIYGKSMRMKPEDYPFSGLK